MFRVGLLGLVFTAGRSRFARRHHRMEGQDECGETYNFGSRRVLYTKCAERPPIDPWGATIIEAENWAGFYCYWQRHEHRRHACRRVQTGPAHRRASVKVMLTSRRKRRPGNCNMITQVIGLYQEQIAAAGATTTPMLVPGKN
ncbi:hypothetical protein Bbelb_369850 [Branchiostoma belcheri]|nr:hypothetical protein Bbelb_369850 [Branchiostoma belcheri]